MLVESKISQVNMQAVCQQTQNLWQKRQHKVFVFRANGDIKDIGQFYQSMAKQLGEIQMSGEDVTLGDRNVQRSGQLWSQVCYDPQFPNAYRHSLNAQPLHTDGSYVENYDCTFMYCIRNSTVGGETIFIDSQAIIDDLSTADPELLSQLTSEMMVHSRSGQTRKQKVLTALNDSWFVNWNYYCVSTDLNEQQKQLVSRFQHYLLNSPGIKANTIAVKLAPGDAVLFKDDQLLHGRNAFEATEVAQRHLYKCGLQVGKPLGQNQ